MVEIVFRRARPGEAAPIRDLIVRSMGQWEHPPGYLGEARELMDLSGAHLAPGEAWVCSPTRSSPGPTASRVDASVVEIEESHLEPSMIGRGIGRRMFEHARMVSMMATRHCGAAAARSMSPQCRLRHCQV